MTDDPDLSPASCLAASAQRHPHRPCLVWFDGPGPGPTRTEPGTGIGRRPARVLEARDAASTVARLARVLTERGVTPGTRVAVVAPNSPWHFLLHAACAWLGAATVPLSPRRPASDLADLLRSCDPVLLLTHGVADIDVPCPRVGLDDLGPLVRAARPADGTPPARHGELATLVHTSGSTGAPRAVELTHANLWWGAQCFREGFEYSPATDVVGVCAPLSHIGGFNGTALDMFSHSGTVVVMDDPFDVDATLDAIERFRVTTMFVVPTMCRAVLVAHARRPRDLSSWRLPLVGGDALDDTLEEELRGIGLRPLHVWGMTETSGAGAFRSLDDATAPPSSIGRPFAHVFLRLVDPAGREVTTPGTPGEVEVAGPGVTTGYFRRPLETARSRDGRWWRTGDLARIDEGGALHLIARLSRMISTGGETVAPPRVEAALRSRPGVRDALVVGIPDRYWGRRVAALVVAEDPVSPPDADDLLGGLADLLAPWELPRTLVWVDALPLTPMGKADTQEACRIVVEDRARTA